MPWTGGGVPGRLRWRSRASRRSNGFASEWLTCRRCCTSRYEPVAASRWPGALPPAGLAATAALAVLLLRQGRGARAARRAARRREAPRRARPRGDARGAGAAGRAVRRGWARGGRARAAARPSSRPAAARLVPAASGCRCPATGSLPVAGDRASRSWRSPCAVWPRVRGPRAAPAPAWACGQRVVPALSVDVGRLHQAAAAGARGGAASPPRGEVTDAARRRAGGRATPPRCRTCSIRFSTSRRCSAARCAARRSCAGCRPAACARTRRTCSALVARAARPGAHGERSDERGAAVAGVVAARRRVGARAAAARRRCRRSRRGCRGGAARRRCSPTASCGGCGASSGVDAARRSVALRARAAGRRRLPASSRCHSCRSAAHGGPWGLGHDALAARRPARARALRHRAGGVGHRQRLRADGRGPRPDVRACSSRRCCCSRCCSLRCPPAQHRSRRDGRPPARGTVGWGEPAHWCAALAFALVALPRPAASRSTTRTRTSS